MNCSICNIEFEDNDNTMFNNRVSFVFKPADTQDSVNPALVTPAELAESRKEYQRTEIATVFQRWGKGEIPAGAFNFRHTHCGVVQTGVGSGGAPLNKHDIRYQRSLVRKR